MISLFNSTASSTSFNQSLNAMSSVVRSGFCTKECGVSMWVFLVIFFFSVVASFASGIPSQQVYYFLKYKKNLFIF